MNIKYPIRVGLMDDDFCALKWNASMLARDLRTTVCIEAETPTGLLHCLLEPITLDIIFLDVEYYPQEPGVENLLKIIRDIQPDAKIICLSQYGQPEMIRDVVGGGADGLLLKNEIRFGIGSAVVLSLQAKFIITPGIQSILVSENNQLACEAVILPEWNAPIYLSPQLKQIATLRVLYGMSAAMVAHEIYLATSSVEKYIQYIYQKLKKDWKNDIYLSGLDLDNFPPEVQAFHRFSLPQR